jgi:hypothetical protein
MIAVTGLLQTRLSSCTLRCINLVKESQKLISNKYVDLPFAKCLSFTKLSTGVKGTTMFRSIQLSPSDQMTRADERYSIDEFFWINL